MAEDRERSTSPRMRQDGYLSFPNWQIARERIGLVKVEAILTGCQAQSPMSTSTKALVGLHQNGCFLTELKVGLMTCYGTLKADAIPQILMLGTLDVTGDCLPHGHPPFAQVLDDDIGAANWSPMVLVSVQSYHQMYFLNGKR